MADDDFAMLLLVQLETAICVTGLAADLHSQRMIRTDTANAIASAADRIANAVGGIDDGLAQYVELLASSASILRQPLRPNRG